MASMVTNVKQTASPHTSEEMLQTIASQFFSTPIIGTLSILIQKGENVVLRCVFGIQKYSKQPQETCTDLFEWYYAYSNDVVDREAALVEIKASCFDIVQSTNVYTIAECKQKLLADALLSIFPKIANNAPQSKKIMDTWKTVFIPYKIVSFLSKRPLLT